MDGEASIARVVAFVEDRQYAALMAQKAKLPTTKWGDAIGPGTPPRRQSEGLGESPRITPPPSRMAVTLGRVDRGQGNGSRRADPGPLP